MLKLFGLVLCVVIAVAVPLLHDNNDDFDTIPVLFACQIDSPDRDECIREGVQDLIPKLANGSKALGIAPTEPYMLDPLSLKISFAEIFSASFRSRDVRIHGKSKGQIKDLITKIQGDNFIAVFKYYNPQLRVEGFYRALGQLSGLKIESKGYFNATATDITMVTTMEGKIVVIDGEKHLMIHEIDATPIPGDLKVSATGIFPDPALNRLALGFGNQYWSVLYGVIMPQVKKQLLPLCITKVNEVLIKVPLKKVFYYEAEAA